MTTSTRGDEMRKPELQGDLLLIPADSIPGDARPADLSDAKVHENGRHIIAHSETGHHHTISGDDATLWMTDEDLTAYLDVKTRTPVTHHRDWDRHDAKTLDPGVWIVRRQREGSPEGWRRVED